jgi:hypothetical protein
MQLGTGLGTKQLRIEKLLLSNCFYYHIIAGMTHTSSANNPKYGRFRGSRGFWVLFGYCFYKQ